jgi:hypothetical protein
MATLLCRLGNKAANRLEEYNTCRKFDKVEGKEILEISSLFVAFQSIDGA